MNIEQEKMIVESLPSLYPMMQEFEEDAIHTVLDALPHWIPCEERLPEDGKQVLVYARGARYALAKYDEMMEADGSYKKQWVTFDAWKPLYTIKEVMAWMPLPEPYKGVTDGND